MTTIQETQQAIIDEFSDIRDWQDRYRKIIQMGKDLAPIDDAYKLDENLVKGCQNRVWLHAELNEDGTVTYLADSEAMIVRGFVALLVRSYSGHSPDEILETAPRFIEELQLGDNISLNRANGLASMVKKIKLYAMAFKAMQARGQG